MNKHHIIDQRKYKLHLVVIILLGIWTTLFSQDEDAYCKCEKLRWEVSATGLDVELVDFTDPVNGEDLNGLKEFLFDAKGYNIKLEEPTDVFVKTRVFPPRVWSSVVNKDQTRVKKCGVKWGKSSIQWDNLMVKRGDMPAEYRLTEDRLHPDSDLGLGYAFFGVFEIIDKSKGTASLLFEGVTHFNPETVYEILGKDDLGRDIEGGEIEPNCWKALCRTPIKITWIWGQDSVNKGSTLKFTPVGTGNTTGNVVVLDIWNPSDAEVKGKINPSIIPPTEKYQGYIIPGTYEYVIPSGESVSIPLDGYCTDIHRNAVPKETPIVDFDLWIDRTTVEELPELDDPANYISIYAKNHPGMEHLGGVPAGGTMCYYPGSTTPLAYKIDINKYPKTAAPFLFSGVDRIINSYHELNSSEMISTPFSADSEKEKESIIQQTFWMYTSALTGDAYKINDLDDNLIEQFETVTGNKANNEQKRSLEEGATVLWNTFSLVGEKAKVLKDNNSYYSCYKEPGCDGSSLGRVNSSTECSKLKGSSMSSGVKDNCERISNN